MYFFHQTNQQLKLTSTRPQIERGIRWTLPNTTILEPKQPTIVEVKLSIRPSQLETGIYQDYLTVTIADQNYDLPYLFINQTAAFPEIAGFELEQSTKDEDIYYLRLQIAAQSEALTVDHYDPTTFAYLGQLYHEENIEAGLLEAEIDLSNSKRLNHYLINVTIESNQQPSSFQQLIKH